MINQKINGLPLPPALVEALARKTWRAPGSPEPWYELFPRSEVVRPQLYGAELMNEVNAAWLVETRPGYLGEADGKCEPGNLDPRKSVLIGELQPDALIALDYRDSMNSPVVVFLMPCGNECRWTRVAPNIESLIEALSIDHS